MTDDATTKPSRQHTVDTVDIVSVNGDDVTAAGLCVNMGVQSLVTG